jgi:hypothetical protein
MERRCRLVRDYSKFLRQDKSLDVSRIPRRIYTQMVNEHRREENVFRPVFEEQFWAWDLEQAELQARERGETVNSADLAQKVLDGMEDNDWWKCMQAFEQHLIDHFHESPDQWAHLLDPVYDEQEQAGWVKRQ